MCTESLTVLDPYAEVEPHTEKPCVKEPKGRKEITKMLSELLEKYIDPHNDPRIYWAREVTFDYSGLNRIRVDYMQFKPVNNSVSGIEKGDFCCYEVKSSVEDFHSGNGHNFVGDMNYYVMPKDVFEKVRQEIHWNIGVLAPEDGHLRVVKNAHRKDRTRPVSEMLLMMWRSTRREIAKARKGLEEQEGQESVVDLTAKLRSPCFLRCHL